MTKCWQDTAAPGTAFPQHLWIQVDNAGGENKNTHICKLCAYLVDAGMFRSVVLSTLQVGHTHEDIDFLFSIELLFNIDLLFFRFNLFFPLTTTHWNNHFL